MKHPYQRYLSFLTGAFGLVWLLLAIKPMDRSDWLLENGLVLIIVPLLILTYRRFPFSRASYTLIFIFLCLHEVGAHYTYAEVPYDDWFRAVAGSSFNSLVGATRNNFDRLVHLCFGLLLAYPIREIFVRVADARGFWSYYLPLDMTMACSMVFELLEWAAAELFGGNLGVAYLGTQGDPWDAQKDMMLASLGALIAMVIAAVINMRQQRDFSREWVESLRVKK